MGFFVLLGLFVGFFFSVNGYIQAHEVTSLPGYNGTLPSKQYSGLLTVPDTSPGRHYHYWLVQSENNASSDPIFWFNGGPGASSLLGYFTEQGPFNLNQRSIEINTTSIPVPFYNKYNWGKVSNIVFLESPAGVGFSYCDGSNGPMQSCPDWNDTLVAEDNHAIIQQFFEYYPEYLTNDFYIFGESYAGIYVPTLVMQIQSDSSGMPPLLGFGVGDGCNGIDGYGGCNLDYQLLFWEFMYGHSQVSNVAYHRIIETCGETLHYGNETLECLDVINHANAKLGGYNVYNIYDMCYLKNNEMYEHHPESGILSGLYRNSNGQMRFHNQRMGFNGMQAFSDPTVMAKDGMIGEGIDQYECGGETVTNIYLNKDEVKEAIHVEHNITWGWQDGNWDKYYSTQHNLIPYYVQWAKEFRILIFYGDVDVGVPYNGGEEWTNMLGYSVSEEWRPWTVDGGEMMAGFVQIFDSPKNLTYVTIKGAGHMVPQYKPEQALKMYEIFLRDMRWPRYNGP